MNAAVRLVEVRVPDMGNFKDVAVIDVLVKPGESIEPEAPLVTLETEKATMDVPSTASGVIEKIHVAKGGTVSTGDLIATVRAAAEPSAGDGAASQGSASAPNAGGEASAAASGATAAAPGAPAKAAAAANGGAPEKAVPASAPAPTPAVAAPVAAAAPAPSAAPSAAASPSTAAKPASAAPSPAADTATGKPSLDLPPINEPGFSRAHAGPSVRKFARELGVDLTRVKGSGFKDRITHDDVKGFVKASLAAPAAAAARATARAPGTGSGGGL
jgi:pyruvate dehydrogenase E2 component (dihydrolipoyllysine-residue acetyltransferase)